MASPAHEMSKWRQTVSNILGRHCLKRYTSIAYDVICVADGIKPALLFDYAMVSPQSMEDFLKACISGGLIPPDQVAILTVGDDLLIYHKECLKQILSTGQPVLIDVTNKKENPRIMRQENANDIIAVIRNAVLSALDEAACQHCVGVYELSIKGINLTTVFGYLLGYPCVYWFDIKDRESQGENCLSMIPLKLFEATVNIQDTPHTTYSFSIPESLYIDSTALLISKWETALAHRTGQKFNFTQKTVTLSAVVL